MGKGDKKLQPGGRDGREEDSFVDEVKTQRLREGCMKDQRFVSDEFRNLGKSGPKVWTVKPEN